MANPFAQFAPTDSTTETKSTEPNQFAKFASKRVAHSVPVDVEAKEVVVQPT